MALETCGRTAVAADEAEHARRRIRIGRDALVVGPASVAVLRREQRFPCAAQRLLVRSRPTEGSRDEARRPFRRFAGRRAEVAPEPVGILPREQEPDAALQTTAVVDLTDCRRRVGGVAAESGVAHLASMVGEAKFLRATLVLTVGSALGAPAPALEAAAVGIELVHLASLVHDDIIDDAAERRGVAALHVVIGCDRALVAGDFLLAAAFAEVSGAAAAELSAGARLCCRGQLEELDGAVGYIDVAAKKTGALFATAAALGALAAGARDDEVDALRSFGACFGTAYQIRDDLGDGAAPPPGSLEHERAATLAAADAVPAPCRSALRRFAAQL